MYITAFKTHLKSNMNLLVHWHVYTGNKVWPKSEYFVGGVISNKSIWGAMDGGGHVSHSIH